MVRLGVVCIRVSTTDCWAGGGREGRLIAEELGKEHFANALIFGVWALGCLEATKELHI